MDAAFFHELHFRRGLRSGGTAVGGDGSPTYHRAETRGYRAALAAPRVSKPAAIAIGAAGFAFHAAVTAGRLSCPPEVYFGRSASRRRHGLWPFNTVPALFLRQQQLITNDKSRPPARRHGFQLCCARLSIAHPSTCHDSLSKDLALACVPSAAGAFYCSPVWLR